MWLTATLRWHCLLVQCCLDSWLAARAVQVLELCHGTSGIHASVYCGANTCVYHVYVGQQVPSDCVLGALMCYRYEDVLHEGNLDEDTPHEEPPPVADWETGAVAEYDRKKRK